MQGEKSSSPINNLSKSSFAWQFIVLPIIAVIVLIILLCFSIFVDCNNPLGRPSCTRILFIGNSFTYVNDLPGTFTNLARAGGHKVETGMSAPGGWTLEQHNSAQETLNLLQNSQWDYVVLQEQSQIPASSQARSQTMYPAARSLVEKIRTEGAVPLFFITWAHQFGWPEVGLNTFESMQSQIKVGYQTIAQELNVDTIPVGNAWLLEHRQNPQLQLWNTDGYHPEPSGTYLAACVFYATIFKQSPVGLKYYDNLPPVTAKELQLQAEQVVFGNQ
jgi:hypothetical protein